MGDLPTRIVVSATNFSATFANVGYLGLQNILDKNEINYENSQFFKHHR